MKTKWILSALLASAITAPAFAGVGVYIGAAPPPLRYEVRPAIPGPGYAWVDGYWNAMSGYPESGGDRLMPVRIGPTPTMTTTTAVGPTTRATGIMKTTVTTTIGDTANPFRAKARPRNGWAFFCLALT
jgi:hypothetical protein